MPAASQQMRAQPCSAKQRTTVGRSLAAEAGQGPRSAFGMVALRNRVAAHDLSHARPDAPNAGYCYAALPHWTSSVAGEVSGSMRMGIQSTNPHLDLLLQSGLGRAYQRSRPGKHLKIGASGCGARIMRPQCHEYTAHPTVQAAGSRGRVLHPLPQCRVNRCPPLSLSGHPLESPSRQCALLIPQPHSANCTCLQWQYVSQQELDEHCGDGDLQAHADRSIDMTPAPIANSFFRDRTSYHYDASRFRLDSDADCACWKRMPKRRCVVATKI